MNLTIKNRDELSVWFDNKRKLEIDVYSIKGSPPIGAIYEDGELITGKVNIAWYDPVNKDKIDIQYLA